MKRRTAAGLALVLTLISVEAAADLDVVVDRLGEVERPPDVVRPRGEDREPARAVADELALVEGTDPLDVLAQPDALLTGQVAPVRTLLLRGPVEERV